MQLSRSNADAPWLAIALISKYPVLLDRYPQFLALEIRALREI